MKLVVYGEEIKSKQASFRRLVCFNAHLPHLIGTQFSCVATSNTKFKIGVVKHVLIKKANCYKGKDLLIKEDEDAPPIR